tara:strand:+ start:1627 stop:2055 length:429 start_codon:yes stop_codon:yes gene_type:complete
MARISTYPLDSVPALGDKLLGTNAGDLATVNFTLTQVKALLRNYTAYAALLTQSGTNAPVATILENSTGGTIVWTYVSPGVYTATITGGTFAAGKTMVFINNGSTVVGLNVGWSSPTTTTITLDSSGNAVLIGASIEIRVYK